ncbi:hypothetical protein ACMUMS_03935 [Acinetobacter courvalinii]|uniref:hypothetical protein n=1 Tax=Acinetobacter courvalinii TaxID=280147 RepID=UPI003A89FE75
MYHSPTQKELKQFIKQCSDADMIWILHVMNKEHEERHARQEISDSDTALVQLDIQALNSLNNTDEIKNKVLRLCDRINERESSVLMDILKSFLGTLSIRGRDLSKYEKDKRLLYFALNQINHNESRHNTFSEIHNEYFRFLYTIFMLPNYYKSNRSLDNLEASFSKIISKHPLHFKNFDSDGFYLWAKSYMDQDKENGRVHNSNSYNPLTPKEYSIVINAIFDSLLDKDANIYKAIKIQLSNAWYQKRHREKNKGRKHHYRLTDKALLSLEILAEKYSITKEKMIESLVNERYTKECMDFNGNDLYSLTR